MKFNSTKEFAASIENIKFVTSRLYEIDTIIVRAEFIIYAINLINLKLNIRVTNFYFHLLFRVKYKYKESKD